MRWKDTRSNEPLFLDEEASTRPVPVRVAVRTRRRLTTAPKPSEQQESQWEALQEQKQELLAQLREIDLKRSELRAERILCNGEKKRGRYIAQCKLKDARLLAERQEICAQMSALKVSLSELAAESRALVDVTAFKFMKAAKLTLPPELYDRLMKMALEEE
jgi:hypothetical protein